jgi:hypothetical protein
MTAKAVIKTVYDGYSGHFPASQERRRQPSESLSSQQTEIASKIDYLNTAWPPLSNLWRARQVMPPIEE